MNELRAIREKIEIGRRKMAFLKEEEARQSKSLEKGKMGTIVTTMAKIKEDKKKEEKSEEIQERVINSFKAASKYAVAAAAVLVVVLLSIHVNRSIKESKNRYDKFKMAMQPVNNSESSTACDFAKKFIIEFGSRGGNGVSSLWSKMTDSEAREEYEVALRRLNPSEVSFNTVDRLPGKILKVVGSSKGSPVIFLLDSSTPELSLRCVEVQM